LMVLVCAMSCRHPMTNNATRSKLLFAKFWIAFIVLLLGCVLRLKLFSVAKVGKKEENSR